MSLSPLTTSSTAGPVFSSNVAYLNPLLPGAGQLSQMGTVGVGGKVRLISFQAGGLGQKWGLKYRKRVHSWGNHPQVRDTLSLGHEDVQ